MASISEIILRTSTPSYQFSFIWIIDNYSELPVEWSKKSEDFSIDPLSSWYVEFTKDETDIYLCLCRNDKKTFKVSCETLILNCNDEMLYKENRSYENSDEVDILGSHRGGLKSLPEDQAIFKILITVKNPEPSTVKVNLPRSAHLSEASLNRMKTLSSDLKKLFDNNIKTDVTFVIGSETLSAHKLILIARSEVFGMMFQEWMAEDDNYVVNIEDVDLSTMKILLSFMYSAELEECDLDTVFEVYRAADKYAVTDLKDACVHTLSRKMTTGDACRVVDMHRHVEVKDKAIQRELQFVTNGTKTPEHISDFQDKIVNVVSLFLCFLSLFCAIFKYLNVND